MPVEEKKCVTNTEAVCEVVTETECKTVQDQVCEDVPKKDCRVVNDKQCRKVPKQECDVSLISSLYNFKLLKVFRCNFFKTFGFESRRNFIIFKLVFFKFKRFFF